MASLYSSKHHGWHIRFKIYFPDASYIIKNRFIKSKQKAHLCLQDVEKLESLSSKNRISREELTYFIHMNYITLDEAQLLNFDKSILIDPTKFTWEKLEDVYFKHIKGVGSERTQKPVKYRMNTILTYFREIPPYRVTTALIQDYMSERRRSVSKSSVNKEVIMLRIMFDYLVREGIIKKNPARETTLFSDLPERLPRCLSPAELKAILQSLKESEACKGYFGMIILTHLFTGMRRHELINLKTKDVDLKRKLIRIIGKGNKERIIEIHPFLSEKVFPEIIRLNKKHTGTYFFGGHDKPLIVEDGISLAFRRFLRRHNLHDVSLHTLRHTFISYLLDSGVPIRKVQEIAGHRSLRTTMKYLHVIPSKSPEIKKLDYGKYLKVV